MIARIVNFSFCSVKDSHLIRMERLMVGSEFCVQG